MKNLLVSLLITASLTVPVMANEGDTIQETKDFYWGEVPNTEETDPDTGDQLSWYVNLNEFDRDFDNGQLLVGFEAVSPDAGYVYYQADCLKDRLKVSRLGYFESENTVNYIPIETEWTPATDTLQSLLYFACEAATISP